MLDSVQMELLAEKVRAFVSPKHPTTASLTAALAMYRYHRNVASARCVRKGKPPWRCVSKLRMMQRGAERRCVVFVYVMCVCVCYRLAVHRALTAQRVHVWPQKRAEHMAAADTTWHFTDNEAVQQEEQRRKQELRKTLDAQVADARVVKQRMDRANAKTMTYTQGRDAGVRPLPPPSHVLL